MQGNVLSVPATLRQIQFRLSVAADRHLTHSDMASIAGVSIRSIGEWMRGSSAPPGIHALLRLLAELPQEDVSAILSLWANRERDSQKTPNHDASNKKVSRKTERTTKSRKKSQHPTQLLTEVKT